MGAVERCSQQKKKAQAIRSGQLGLLGQSGVGIPTFRRSASGKTSFAPLVAAMPSNSAVHGVHPWAPHVDKARTPVDLLVQRATVNVSQPFQSYVRRVHHATAVETPLAQCTSKVVADLLGVRLKRHEANPRRGPPTATARCHRRVPSGWRPGALRLYRAQPNPVRARTG